MHNLRDIQLPEEMLERLPELKSVRQLNDEINSLHLAACRSIQVNSLEELIAITSEIALLNPGVMVFFRGQPHDYGYGEDGTRTTLLPSIYRGTGHTEVQIRDLQARFDKLRLASKYLREEMLGPDCEAGFSPEDEKQFSRELVRWGFIQHYGVLDHGTPMLDLTQSVRMACWFALDEAKQGIMPAEPTVYAIGVPYPNGPVTIDVSEELYELRLTGIMPSFVRRPLFQEGYLVMPEFFEPEQFCSDECDFSLRLLGKFRLSGPGGGYDWQEAIGSIPREMVYPTEDDSLKIRDDIRRLLGETVQDGKPEHHESDNRQTPQISAIATECVGIIKEHGPLGISTISQMMGLSKKTVFRVVTGLVRKGLVRADNNSGREKLYRAL